MFTVISCLTTQHDYRYVLLAAMVAVLGSVLTMRLFSRVRRAYGPRRFHWLFLSAVLGGGTIWTTHFVAMLGYELPFRHSYDLTLTIVSLVLAVTLTALGLFVSSLSKQGPEIEAGGAILGIGIATMHYTGMAALNLEGTIQWNTTLVVASVLLGMIFGAIATNRIARPVTRFCKYGGASALVLAICTMHFTGMGAMTIVPAAGIVIPPQAVSDAVLISGVLALMMILLATGASTYMIDQHTTQEALDRYKHLALHDPLTGLPNRAYLNSRLAEIMQKQQDATSRIAIATFDLDRFKQVNDVHGHAAGDAVLRAVAENLSTRLRDGDLLARIGGDEFVAMRPDVFTRSAARKFADDILETCQQPIDWSGSTLHVGTSIGISIFPDDGDTADSLLGRADLAMYRAKTLGRNQVCLFDESMDETNRERSALTMDLRNAVANGELEVHFQPQNDTRTRAILGFEALLRWHHPERGTVSPAEFIPIAEETGLIVEIGEWVLRRACREAASWNEPYCVAVNVAAGQLLQPDLPKIVHEALVDAGLSPSRLEIEITESGIIADQQHALHVIRQLKSLGIRIAMDDFGTGYSSLATLKNFPFDKIKIDRTFVEQVNENPQAAAIVKATIILGNSLNIPVLAEGVETDQHIAFLSAEGCAELQGFYFGRPTPGKDLAAKFMQVNVAGAQISTPGQAAADDAVVIVTAEAKVNAA